ncbi:hypothetical protein [Haloprofundus halobius]|uniref:hypothetical protein n=1 Tax=Haloprofundus halobius TaxID=2876194 RepID=UPI001CCA4542|nr:hypothetical protein [Haloprofundus halobius]
MSSKSFEQRLEKVYKKYQHSELENRLNDVAQTMEETVLQRVLAEEFLHTDIEIDERAKEAVEDAKAHLNDGDLDSLSEEIEELEQMVDEEERKVDNRIQEARISMSKKMNGMQRLNQRVERVSEIKLESIASLLDDWNWKEQVYRNDDAAIETLKDRSREYGSDMRRFYEEAKADLFGPYKDTPLEGIVDGLLDDERFALDDLSDAQLQQLRDSDLEEHVELSLS